MTTQSWILELHRASWRLIACDGEVPSIEGTFTEGELVEQSQAILTSLAETGYTSEPILVALASTWCVSATLPIARPQELRDRQTMLYRFEECTPWSIEDFVADYRPAGKQAFMVAVRADPLAEFIRELAAQGILVQSIVPQALLACDEHFNSNEGPTPHMLALEQAGWVELITVSDERPESWLTVPAEGDSVRREMARLATEHGHPVSIVGYGLHEKTTAALETVGNNVHEIKQNCESGSELARRAAKRILKGSREALVELKRDAFGRSHGHAALRPYRNLLQTAIALLIVSIIGCLLLRGYQSRAAYEKLALQQSEIFRSVFPNAKVPVGIKGRLDSELAKLRGLQGESTILPDSVSTMRMLYDLLAALPTDRRFRLNEIRLEEGRLHLDGEVREHGDAEWIAQRLRSQALEVSSPRTQRLDDQRVSLRITAKRQVTTKPAAKEVR